MSGQIIKVYVYSVEIFSKGRARYSNDMIFSESSNHHISLFLNALSTSCAVFFSEMVHPILTYGCYGKCNKNEVFEWERERQTKIDLV